MVGIPPALDADAEDVVWALQTAEALWKRNERVDAIVWVRRAAQAAGEAEQDDRALTLAREAAELSDYIASNPLEAVGTAPSTAPPHEAAGVDDLLGMGEIRVSLSDIQVEDTFTPEESSTLPSVKAPPVINAAPPAPQAAPPPVAPEPPPAAPPATPPPAQAAPAVALPQATPPPPASGQEARPVVFQSVAEGSSENVRSAAEAHAGMLDPWSEPPEEETTHTIVDSESAVASSDDYDEDEVVTSARMMVPAVPSEMVPAVVMPPSPPPVPRKPPPVPPKKEETAAPDEDVVSSTQTVSSSELVPPSLSALEPEDEPTMKLGESAQAARQLLQEAAHAPVTGAVRFPPEQTLVSAGVVKEGEEAAASAGAGASAVAEKAKADAEARAKADAEAKAEAEKTRAAPEPKEGGGVDLSSVDALADLPDDARHDLESVATIHSLSFEEEVMGFALAYVIRGEVDVAAQIVDAPAERLKEGAILKARGGVAEAVPLRLICASESAVVATWDTAHVEPAFKSCPWVEDELREEANRIQALVGVTLGPIADRLDASIRAQVTSRLAVRELAEGETVVEMGQPVKEMCIVGQGELELLHGDKVVASVGTGEFLFPSEILGAGKASASVRAGKGGALLLVANRAVAQELMVTCPPLLEIFAGM